jgi:DNA-binding CsgD family transcriptional regulator
MADTEHDRVVETIYEAAVNPDSWIDVIDGVSKMSNSSGATLFVASQQQMRWICAKPGEEIMDDYARGGWVELDQHVRRASRMPQARFVSDLELFTPEELAADPHTMDFRIPHGLAWCTGLMVASPMGHRLAFSLNSRPGRAPYSRADNARLDLLVPHLKRAMVIAAQMDLQKVGTAMGVLERIGLPAAAIGASGRLIASNTGFAALIPQVLRDHRERLVFAESGADSSFVSALQAIRFHTPDRLHAIPVPAVSAREARVAHLLPIAGSAHDVFVSAAAIMVFLPGAPAAPPPPEVLAALFDLSPAEGRVARAIVAGGTVEEVAGIVGTSRETVRSQLKSVYAKTESEGRAELIDLLRRLTLPL